MHETQRTKTKQNEMQDGKTLIINGKFFHKPPKEDMNFKDLFFEMASAGAGRPADENGLPIGPWTAELLAEAISGLQANKAGIGLRTVQHWFQENDKAIRAENIRWLSLVFGCEDRQATIEWQKKLTAAKAKLLLERRMLDATGSIALDRLDDLEPTNHSEADEPNSSIIENHLRSVPNRTSSLAQLSEAIFSRPSPLDVPASVFGGSVALGFLSYIFNIHSVVLDQRQIGFLWAPNWTFLFMIFLPAFFGVVVDLLAYWREEGRPKLAHEDMHNSSEHWLQKIEASSITFWAVLIVCLPLAGFAQWYGTRLRPLMEADRGTFATDWGAVAISRPDIVTTAETILFTGIAYAYMCICFYLLFVGLIILYTIAFDLKALCKKIETVVSPSETEGEKAVVVRIIAGIFRCTILGLWVAICMKLQSFYLKSGEESIVLWLTNDLWSVFFGADTTTTAIRYSLPTHYSSLLVALATCVTFAFGVSSVKIGSTKILQSVTAQAPALTPGLPLKKLVLSIAIIVATYLLIDAFSGFSILLIVGLMISIYTLITPPVDAL